MTARATAPHSNRTLGVLLVAGLAYAVSQTAVIPAIPGIQARLHASESSAAWTLSGFFIAGAVTTGLFGRLGDMHGKKRMLSVVLVLFTVGSVVAALSNTIGLLIAGRVIMGAGGAIFPLAFGIARDELPPKRLPTAMGLLSAVIGAGTGVGLLAGGLISDHASYRWIFWLVTALAVCAVIGVVQLVPESPIKAPSRLDLIGAVLLSVGIAAPMIAISQANSWGWSAGRTVGLIAAGIVVLGVFGVYEHRFHAPLIHLPTFVRRQVVTTNLTTILAGFGLFGSSLLSAQFVQVRSSHGFGFSSTATQAGLFLLPAALVMLAISAYAGKLSAKIGPRGTLILGAASATAGLALFALFHGASVEFYFWNALVYLGVGLVLAATPILIIGDVPAARTAESTAANSTVRYIGSALGAQVAAAIVASSPTAHGYTVAFLIGAIGTGAAVLAAFAIPDYRHHAPNTATPPPGGHTPQPETVA